MAVDGTDLGSRHGSLRGVVFASILCFIPTAASAEIIVDDFDDPAQIITPAMQGDFIETENVGDLKGERRMRISASQGNPSGFLDSNVSSPSTLTGQITRLNPVPFGETLSSVQSNYTFPTSDFAQGDQNDAIFFDFKHLTSEMPPSFFMILLRDTNDFFLYLERPVRLSSQPFALVAPFDRFTFRDGQAGSPDFSSITALNVELRISAVAGGGPDPLNFFMQLDRIRIGRVPEPNLFALLVGGFLALIGPRYPRGTDSLWRNRKCDQIWLT